MFNRAITTDRGRVIGIETGGMAAGITGTTTTDRQALVWKLPPACQGDADHRFVIAGGDAPAA
jgi:hypothetical protein